MAKVEFLGPIASMSGRMGDVVFRYNKKTGKTSISKVPDMSKVKWSKAQKAHRRRWKKAIAYAQDAKTKPEIWSLYQKIADKKDMRAWDLAVRDYFQGKTLLANT